MRWPISYRRPRWARSLAVGAASAAVALGVSAIAEAQAPKPAPRKTLAPTSYLPDSAVLARVDGRAIRVKDYVERYFNSYVEFRPSGDSTGRHKFLQTMIDKEIIAKVARAAKRPETFEERGVMKAHTQRVLGNILFKRAVSDSVRVSEDEVRAVYEQMKRELHLGRIGFGTRQTAERMRADLAAGRVSWARAWDLRVRLPGDTTRSYDIGWRKREATPPHVASVLFALPVGAVSPVIAEPPTYAVYQIREERPYQVREYSIYRDAIMQSVRGEKIGRQQETLLSTLRTGMGLKYDEFNIAWAAAQFPSKIHGSGTSNLVIDTTVPTFAPADTARVLATFNGGQVTVGTLVQEVTATPDMLRPNLDTADNLRIYLDVMVLEPRMAEIARQRGLDRDSLAIYLIERRREEIMVENLFQDSIAARIFVPPAARRKYYQENEYKFVTAPNARYALFGPMFKPSMDSLSARLRRGVPAHEIIRADSARNLLHGVIETRNQDDTGRPFHRELFTELRDGEVRVIGPDIEDEYYVIQLIERDSGRKVSFEEGDRQIDEYLQQEEADRLLAEFTKRHRRRAKIEAHPELLMRVNLVDPGVD